MQRYEERMKKTMPVVCSECGVYLGGKGYQCVERLSSGHVLEMIFCNEEHYELWMHRHINFLEDEKEVEMLKLRRKRESWENNIFEVSHE